MNWFRVYADIIDDPKILALPRAYRWHVIELFAIASRQVDRPVGDQLAASWQRVDSELAINSLPTGRGQLPSVREIAIHLRLSLPKTKKVVQTLVDAGFIDVSPDGKTYKVHGWEKRQFKSDDISARSRTSMKRSRERSRAQPVNVHVNVTDTDTDTDTETEGESPTPFSVVAAPIPDTPETRAVMAMAAERWGASNGDALAGDLLRTFPPRIVSIAADRTWDKFGARINAAYWRSTCQGIYNQYGDQGPPEAAAPDPYRFDPDRAANRTKAERAAQVMAATKADLEKNGALYEQILDERRKYLAGG